MNPGNAWRRAGEANGGTIACTLYLARHSDYLDGELTADERVAHEAHEAVCGSCARYASVLRHGSGLLRELPEILPSTDFQQRLQHRIYHVQDGTVLSGGGFWRSGWLAAAAGFVLLAGGSLLVDLQDGRLRDRPGTNGSPAPELRTAQLADSWTTPAVPRASAVTPLPAALVGYSPVVVRPPLYQPVSYELLAGE